MSNEMTTDNMSNEEVIEVLKGIVFNSFDRTTPKERQALHLAIKSLVGRPQGDLISREALKKKLEEMANNEWNIQVGSSKGLEDAIDVVDNAPTVEIPKHSLLPLAGDCDEAYMRGYNHGKAEGILKAHTRPKGEWIPIKYRPLTVKERIALAEHYGIEYCDTSEEKAFDCPMPEDKQAILLSTSYGVVEDVADNDIDGEGFICYGLETNGDWDGVDAWMPKPEQYKKGGDNA